jgi:hypothetical protein
MFKTAGGGGYGCDSETCTLLGGGSVSAQLLASVVVYLDVAYSALFLLALPLLRRRLAAHAVAAKRASVADFAVEVWGLPHKVPPAEVHAHFDKLARGPAKKADGAGGEEPKGEGEEAVQSVFLVHSDGGALRGLKKMVRLQDQLEELKTDLKLRPESSGVQATKEKVTKLEKEVGEWEKKLSLSERRGSRRRILCAYVVFRTRQAREDCLRRYTGPRSKECSLFYWGQRRELRLHGCRLTVRKAAEPADVQWENLESGWVQRACRRLCSWLVSLFLLALALVAVVADKTFLLKLRSSHSECVEPGFAPRCNAALRWDAAVAGCPAPAPPAGCTLADLWGAGLVGGPGTAPAGFPGDPLLVPLDVNMSLSPPTVLLLGADECRLANGSAAPLNRSRAAAKVVWLPGANVTRECAAKAQATRAQWEGLVTAGWRPGVLEADVDSCNWCFCEVTVERIGPVWGVAGTVVIGAEHRGRCRRRS